MVEESQPESNGDPSAGISRRTLQYKLSEYQKQGFAVDE